MRKETRLALAMNKHMEKASSHGENTIIRTHNPALHLKEKDKKN
jgi:hypothetical protein